MDRLYSTQITVPAMTPALTPVSQVWQLEDKTLRDFTVIVPTGHNGQTGIRLLLSQQQIFPWGNNSYLVASGEQIPVSYNEMLSAGKLTVQAYNTDVWPHTFYLRATITDHGVEQSQLVNPITLIANSQLSLPAYNGTGFPDVGP